MLDDKDIKQEQLDSVSGGTPFDVDRNPLNKQRYVVDYKKGTSVNPNGEPEILSYYLGLFSTKLDAENAGRYYCEVNQYHFIDVRVIEG